MLKSALSLFLFSCLLGSLDCTVQTVKQGEDATLECYGPTDATTILLRWEKTDLQSELYVFYLRDGRPNEKYQLPSFKGRVKLKDPEMKNGDFSVILKNVSMDDAGKYECHAGYNKTKAQLMNNITLNVEESGPSGGQSGDEVNEEEVKEDEGEKSGSVRQRVGLSVPAVLLLLVGVVGFMIYRKRRKQSNPDNQPPPDQGL